MAHAAHTMTHAAHAMHGLEASMARSKARGVTSPLHTIHVAAMALAHVTGTLAMNRLVVGVVGTHTVARVMRVAHNFSKVEPVIVRNLAPTFPVFVHCYDVVEALPGGVRQQVRLL